MSLLMFEAFIWVLWLRCVEEWRFTDGAKNISVHNEPRALPASYPLVTASWRWLLNFIYCRRYGCMAE